MFGVGARAAAAATAPVPCAAMSSQRVLVTGGAGTVGEAVVRRLLADAGFEVRVADRREAPHWIREGCEVHAGDLRDLNEARRAVAGCTHVVHLAGIAADPQMPHTVFEVTRTLDAVVLRAGIDHGVERFVYASTAAVYERATRFPTPEDHLDECAAPAVPFAFAKLAGERLAHAAAAEHGFGVTVCRLAAVYGPGGAEGELELASSLNGVIRAAAAGARPIPLPGAEDQTCPPTHANDVAGGILAALGEPAAIGETLNLAAERELTLEAIARTAWVAAGGDPGDFAVAPVAPSPRLAPAPERARRVLGWEAAISFEAGAAATVAWLREHEAVAT
jgi:nucleoside-diphosphate-sugar epimerase